MIGFSWIFHQCPQTRFTGVCARVKLASINAMLNFQQQQTFIIRPYIFYLCCATSNSVSLALL